MAYVFIGGFLAVSWTDTIQASLMITALILAPLMVIYADGGVGPSAAIIETARSGAFDMFRGQTVIAIISLLAWGLGYFGQPHILVRFMAAESVQTIPNARRIGMTWMVLCLGGAVAVGFFGIAFFQPPRSGGGVNGKPNRVPGSRQAAVQPLDQRRAAGRRAGGRDEHLVLPVAGLLQRPHGHLQNLFAQAGQPKQLVWFGRAMVFVIAVIAILIAGPRKQGAGHGQQRLGRLWRGLRPAGAALAAVGA
jgi:sodium/proline symporter